jgi:hypothetical protein
VERGIKLERTNIHVDAKGIEHYPLFAAAFLFPSVELKVSPSKIDPIRSGDERPDREMS